ncbi:MAG: hypothetical protein H0X25_23735 [Acidobacteriales bacterium]|nr:hypothetical protein [Terriglobales bacterium]
MDLDVANAHPAAQPALALARAFDSVVAFAPLPEAVLLRLHVLPSYWLNEAVSSARQLPAEAVTALDEALSGSSLCRVGPLIGMQIIQADSSQPLRLQPFFGINGAEKTKSPNRVVINLSEIPVAVEIARALGASGAESFGAIENYIVKPGGGLLIPVAVFAHRLITEARVCVLQGYFSA